MRKKVTVTNFDVDYYLQDVPVIIRVKGFDAGRPAKISGSPEDSYPAEGAEWDYEGAYIVVEKIVDGKKKKVEVKLPDEIFSLISDDYLDEAVIDQGIDATENAYDDYCDHCCDENRRKI